MTNNNQVNWDKIPEDVEAVIIHNGEVIQHLKTDGGCLLMSDRYNFKIFYPTEYKTLDGREVDICKFRNGIGESKLLRRPQDAVGAGHRGLIVGGVSINTDKCVTTITGVIQDPQTVGVDHGLSKEELELLSRHLTHKEFEWYKKVSAQMRKDLIKKPTPVTPESTQVETSEVEATTTPEFDWSSVEDDVEAVIAKEGNIIQQLTSINGILYHKGEMFGKERWIRGHYRTLAATEKYLHLLGCGKWKLIRRPPAITPPEENVTCKVEFYEGELPEGMINLDPSSIQTETYTPKPPSILTILQEAQQSILKHHGVTGKVKFTVICSE